MRPPETMPHGTTLRPVVGGFRIDRPGRETYGRIFVRLRRDRTAWYAACDAWDGFTWTRDKTITRPTIDELENEIRRYVVGLDNHARACTCPQ